MAGPFEERESTSIGAVTPRRLALRARPHLLDVVEGPPTVMGKRLRLQGDQLVLGRGVDVDLVLEADQLSRQHLVLTRLHGEYVCTDLDSRNGLFLNGMRVHSVVLRDGDQLQLGDVTLVYSEGA